MGQANVIFGGDRQSTNLSTTFNRTQEKVDQTTGMKTTSVQEVDGVSITLENLKCSGDITGVVQTTAQDASGAETAALDTVVDNLMTQLTGNSNDGGAQVDATILGINITTNETVSRTQILQAIKQQCETDQTALQVVRNASFNMDNVACSNVTGIVQRSTLKAQCYLQTYQKVYNQNESLQNQGNSNDGGWEHILSGVLGIVVIVVVVGILGFLGMHFLQQHGRGAAAAAYMRTGRVPPGASYMQTVCDAQSAGGQRPGPGCGYQFTSAASAPVPVVAPRPTGAAPRVIPRTVPGTLPRAVPRTVPRSVPRSVSGVAQPASTSTLAPATRMPIKPPIQLKTAAAAAF